MKIKTVAYSQSRETMYGFGLKRWDKVGMEIELEENDTPEQAYALAHQFVNEKIEQGIEQQNEIKGTQERIIEAAPGNNEDRKQQQINGWIEAMNSCKSLKVLGIYEKMVARENIDILYETFNSNKKRLENEQN